jgi:hypothetical protein
MAQPARAEMRAYLDAISFIGKDEDMMVPLTLPSRAAPAPFS